MFDFLKENSEIVKSGAALSAIPWLIGDLITPQHNKVMGGLFLEAGAVGIFCDNTKTGVVTHYALSSCAYVAMGMGAIGQHNTGEAIAAIGGLLASAKVIADNLDGSWYQEKTAMLTDKLADYLPAYRMTGTTGAGFGQKMLHAGVDAVGYAVGSLIKGPASVVQFLAMGCQSSRNKRMQKFGEDVLEITNRPMFTGSAFGAMTDFGYIGTGLATGNVSMVLTGIGWYGGYALASASLPKDGQKHIFVSWAETIREKLSKPQRHNKPAP